MTGSAGIVVEVVVDDAADELVGATLVDDELVVDSTSLVVVISPAVVDGADSPPLLHAVIASATIMNVAVVLVYLTVLSAVQSALRAGIGVSNMCSSSRCDSVGNHA
jgi:hypothetical protein